MTEPVASHAAPAAAPLHSRDYWETVWGQFRKRRSARVALVLLLLLYAVAIYAPFLANDRPLLFEGTDAGAYRKARRELLTTSAALVDVARGGRAAHQASLAQARERGAALTGKERDAWLRGRREERTFEQRLAGERQGLAVRVATMRRQLAEPDAAPLQPVVASADALVAAALADAADDVEQHARALVVAVEDARDALDARPADEADPAAGRPPLQAFRELPVLAAISAGEVYLMALWALVLTWPLWSRGTDRWLLAGDPIRRRRARRPKALALVLLPLVPALVWALGEGGGSLALGSAHKAGLSEGSMHAERVVHTPIPFGMAEQNHTEVFRPPTWAPSARISDDGYYLSGPRSARVDSMTGMPIRGEVVEIRVGEPALNAGTRHVLGTDSLGRDIFSRLVWGARVSLSVGLVSTVILVLIGTVLGALAGYFGGWVDTLISRVIEVFQCFPVFFLILIVVAFVGQGIVYIMLAIGLFRWTGVARLVRGEFLRLREQDFVVASRALGAGDGRTIFRHVLPNAMGPVLVSATFAVASGILTESALSFLGFGVQLPVPSWGSLLIESSSAEHWWIQVFPGAFIFLTVILYNVFGEGVRDALDPRLKEA